MTGFFEYIMQFSMDVFALQAINGLEHVFTLEPHGDIMQYLLLASEFLLFSSLILL